MSQWHYLPPTRRQKAKWRIWGAWSRAKYRFWSLSPFGVWRRRQRDQRELRAREWYARNPVEPDDASYFKFFIS